MEKLRIIVALTNNDNDYQLEQAVAAQAMGQRLEVDIEVIHADNDAITQSQQLLNIIQSTVMPRPDGIVFEPVGATALPQVARAAAMAGIGWVVLNRDVEYLADLRRSYRVPAFSISSDHEEIGRIQGRQFQALLPKGGSVLYVRPFGKLRRKAKNLWHVRDQTGERADQGSTGAVDRGQFAQGCQLLVAVDDFARSANRLDCGSG